MISKFTWGQPVWPSQDWADKSDEIELGYIVDLIFDGKIYIYTVAYKDGFTIEVEESKLSKTRPLPPNPNNLLKKLI